MCKRRNNFETFFFKNFILDEEMKEEFDRPNFRIKHDIQYRSHFQLSMCLFIVYILYIFIIITFFKLILVSVKK